MRSILRPLIIIPVIVLVLIALSSGLFVLAQARSTVAVVPAGTLEALPVYPQAENVAIIERESTSPKLNYKVVAPEADVLTYYSNWFLNEGWEDATPSVHHNTKTFSKIAYYSRFELTESFPWIVNQVHRVPLRLRVYAYTMEFEGKDRLDVTIMIVPPIHYSE